LAVVTVLWLSRPLLFSALAPDAATMQSHRHAARSLAATTLGVAALITATATSQAAAPGNAPSDVQHRWVHHTDVNGDGVIDRVVLIAGDDLTVQQGTGSGHFTVRFKLGGLDYVGDKRMRVDYYYGGRGSDWTPWFGATQIDHHPGKDVIVGSTSGAHTQVYNIVTLHRGAMRTLEAPGDGPEKGWALNASVGTGAWGYRCTDDGVQSRLVYPNRDHTRYHIDRSSYVREQSDWTRTHHFHETVDANAHGDPPHYTSDYATFDCKGLPDHW
jgi:hypothetical protein